MPDQPATALSISQSIQFALAAADSDFSNPLRHEQYYRPVAALVAEKFGRQLSPSNRCMNRTGLKLCQWVSEQHEVVPLQGDIGADDPQSHSTVSTTQDASNRVRACDAMLFYLHLPYNFDPANGLPPPSVRFPRIPLVLIQIRGNVSRKLEGNERLDALAVSLRHAQEQLGEQAGFFFGNRLFQQQPHYVIGIAMAAEVWYYAIFYRDQRPQDFEQTCVWDLPKRDWSEPVFWDTLESNEEFDEAVSMAVDLLVERQIPVL